VNKYGSRAGQATCSWRDLALYSAVGEKHDPCRPNTVVALVKYDVACMENVISGTNLVLFAGVEIRTDILAHNAK
jgi:hypothetical protein